MATLTATGRLRQVLTALEAWGAERDWEGTDPYDGLNATRLVHPLLRARRGRQAVTQLVKRSPIDLRPVLGIAPARSAAGLAHVVSSYARNGFLPDEVARRKLEEVVTQLLELRCEGFDEPCWGYHFDVQTRVFFYPRGAPNVIATTFAGQALLDAFEATGRADLLEGATGAGDFCLRRVPQTDDDGGAFFGYLAGDRTPIHNSNMLVSALLTRISAHTGRADMASASGAALAYTVSRQREDGSWPYGELPHLGWVDGFHTGYVLESIASCLATGASVPGAGSALDRGLDFYRRELFGPDGTPMYMPASTYPIDSQCAAQGIQTFARTSRQRPQLLEGAWKVFRYAEEHLKRRDGAFAFQRRRLWRNTTPHVRWTQAPMLQALTHLLEAARERGEPTA